jgi:hypothetical protein
MYDLVNHIMEDTTTSADIAYLPGGFEPVQQWFKKLKKTKAKWGTTVIDAPSMYEVQFEHELTVRVPKEHWEEFSSHVGGLKVGMNEVDLGQYVMEAKAEEFGYLWTDIEDALGSIFENKVVLDTNDDVQSWMGIFGGAPMNVSREAAMDFSTTDADADIILKRIRKEYAEEPGDLQMLIDALKDKKPLRSFDVLNDYDYLIGSRIESGTEYGKIIFEAFVDLLFKPTEKIYVENEAVLEALEEEHGVKVVKKNIYPVGDKFPAGFFQKIKTVIKDMEE